MCLVRSRHGTPAVALSGSAVNIAHLLVGRSADSGGGKLARDAPMFHVCSSSSSPISAVVLSELAAVKAQNPLSSLSSLLSVSMCAVISHFVLS